MSARDGKPVSEEFLARHAKYIEDRNCGTCGVALTIENTNWTWQPSTCNSCEMRIRDELAWLTGTGRFAQ